MISWSDEDPNSSSSVPISSSELKSTYSGPIDSQTAPEQPRIPWNVLVLDEPKDSEDNELDEFFRFLVWNDVTGEEEEEEQKQNVTEDELESSISVFGPFAVFDNFDEYLPQACDRIVRFSLSAQEAKYGFLLQANTDFFPKRS